MPTSLAIVRNSDGRVLTFVRPDTPPNWTPPPDTHAVPDDELPAGWTMATDLEPVLASITARQIRLWLVAHGINLATVDAAIDSIADPSTRDAVRVEWEYAPYVERQHPWLTPLAAALGLEPDAVDQAFREAATL